MAEVVGGLGRSGVVLRGHDRVGLGRGGYYLEG